MIKVRNLGGEGRGVGQVISRAVFSETVVSKSVVSK